MLKDDVDEELFFPQYEQIIVISYEVDFGSKEFVSYITRVKSTSSFIKKVSLLNWSSLVSKL